MFLLATVSFVKATSDGFTIFKFSSEVDQMQYCFELSNVKYAVLQAEMLKHRSLHLFSEVTSTILGTPSNSL